MKSFRLLSHGVAVASILFLSNAGCQHATPASPATAAGTLVPVGAGDAAWVAKAKAEYPLTTCVVCGDPLTHSGGPLALIYQEPGQPDRLVLLCGDECLPEFNKSPTKYLKMIDAAYAAKNKASPGVP